MINIPVFGLGNSKYCFHFRVSPPRPVVFRLGVFFEVHLCNDCAKKLTDGLAEQVSDE